MDDGFALVINIIAVDDGFDFDPALADVREAGGEVFGREGRGATGFSINIRNITNESAISYETRPTVVVASKNESGLWQEMIRLREEGYTVVESGETADCDYMLICENGSWVLAQGKK